MISIGDLIALPDGVADIYNGVAKLEAKFPGRPFTPDGHLVGSIGEVIAAKAFGEGFKLMTPSTKGYDAVCSRRGDVQVKLIGAKATRIALNGPCDHLVVFQICDPPTHARLVYDGPSDGLFESLSGTPGRQRPISVTRLAKWGRDRGAEGRDYLQELAGWWTNRIHRSFRLATMIWSTGSRLSERRPT
jgi:hypothetical protein